MIFEKLKDIISEQLGVDADEVTNEANIQDDLGADSLDVVDPELISFSMDWLDLLVVQGTLKSLLQHHSSKA